MQAKTAQSKISGNVFFNGPPKDLPVAHPHEPPLGMKLPAMLLVTLCIVVGVLPALTLGTRSMWRPPPWLASHCPNTTCPFGTVSICHCS